MLVEHFVILLEGPHNPKVPKAFNMLKTALVMYLKTGILTELQRGQNWLKIVRINRVYFECDQCSKDILL